MTYILTVLLVDFVCDNVKLVWAIVAVDSSATSLTAAIPASAVLTNSVVASWAVLVPAEAVGASGIPVNVGETDKTVFPVPVEVDTPVPPFSTGRMPVTPVLSGNPVRFVASPEAGVPKSGVTRVGLVSVLLVNVSVPSNVAKVPDNGRVTDVVPDEVKVVVYAPEVIRLPPSVIVFPVLSIPVPPLATGKIPVTPVVSGNPVRFVATPEAGVPKAGVTRVGLVSVLLVNVSVPSNVAKIPDNGRVTDVVPDEIKVVAYAPEVLKLPPSVIVFPALSMPVPPLSESSMPL